MAIFTFSFIELLKSSLLKMIYADLAVKETLDKRGLSGSSKEASVPLPVEYF